MKNAEHKIFCNCVDGYKLYQGKDYDKICEDLSKMKYKNIKIIKILIENYKDMLEYTEFEQNQYSKTTEGTYIFGHDSIRLLNWLFYADRSYYEKVN